MRRCWTTMGANGHSPDLHLLQHLSAFLSSMLTFFLCQKSWISLLGCSSVQSHSDRALSFVGPEPTRLRIRGLRPGQGTARTYQGLPAGVLSPCRAAVRLFLKEVRQAEPRCFSTSLANVTKRKTEGKIAGFLRVTLLIQKALCCK